MLIVFAAQALQKRFFQAPALSESFCLTGLFRSAEMLDVAPQGFADSALLFYACAFRHANWCCSETIGKGEAYDRLSRACFH
jgi:hypothetical protein